MSREDYDYMIAARDTNSRGIETTDALNEVKNSSFLNKKRINLFSLQNKKKVIAALIYIVVLIIELELYESVVVVMDFMKVEAVLNPILIFFNALTTHPEALVLMLLLDLVITFVVYKKFSLSKVNVKEDERGFQLDESNAAGASRFLTDEEKRRIFDYQKPKYPSGNILGIDKKSKELITVPFDMNKSEFTNRNMALFGPPGTRKTSGVLIPNIFSNILAGNPIICSDPKGELYKETYPAAKYYGYKIRVFNILSKQFKNSDGWDCLKPIRVADNPTTVAATFANVILANSSGVSKGDFWDDANLNCLMLALLYVAKAKSFVPSELRKNVNESKEDGYSCDREFTAQRTIKEVYSLITSDDMKQTIEEAISGDPYGDGKLLEAPFNVWSKHSQADSIRSGLGTALNFLQSEEVANILSIDEIDFVELASSKTIIYIVCPDNDQTFKPILTLFFTLMFREVTSIADEMPGSSLPKPLFVILEEAGNIGQIPGMSQYVSTVRSRNIAMLFCFQTIGQIQDIYGSKMDGKHEYETILAGCSIKLCLGANDLTTQKYFSDLSGMMSRIDVRETEERNKIMPEGIQRVAVLDKKRMTSTTSRPTLFPDEVGKIKKNEILICPASENVTIEDKYFYQNHPLYNIYLHDVINDVDVPEHLTKHHVPKWRADEIKRSIRKNNELTDEEKDYQLQVIASDEDRFESRVGKRPSLSNLNNNIQANDISNKNRSYSSFKRK